MLYGELSSSEIGPIYVAATNKGIARVSLWQVEQDKKTSVSVNELQAFQHLTTALTELDLYLDGGTQSLSVSLDLGHATDFQKLVLNACLKIPFGKVSTYRDLAQSIGKPNATRAVASALASNPILFFIPCHRVVGSDARLHGFAAPQGVLTKASLLRLEGHALDGDRIIS